MNQFDIEKIVEKIRTEKDQCNLRSLLYDYHPYDVAQIFSELNEEERQLFYRTFKPEEIADVFEYIDEEKVVTYLEEMNLTIGAKILNEMETDDAADVLNEMEEPALIKHYLDVIPEENREELNYLTKHEDDTAGSIMSTNYIEIEVDMDVKDAMKKMVQEASDSELIDPLFVCEKGILKGILTLKDLIVARSPKKIKEIMDDSDLVYCNVDDDISTATNMIRDYGIQALPVVDNMKLVGIITIDDAIDEVVEDVKEDYNKLATVEDETPEKTNIFKSIIHRIPWLVGLLVISLLVSNITSSFEQVIVEVTIFAFFQSMIFDMAGNAGTQSLAVTVRSISRHELDTKKGILKHLGKEFLIALVTALILGTITFVTSYIYMLIRNDANLVKWLVALILSGSLSLSLLVTEMLGSLVPLLFYKIKVDPAVASGPLITTLSDTISILIYFGLATLFLSQILVG
ncbi:MAG: magnesium transporter [Bacilli bacterium]